MPARSRPADGGSITSGRSIRPRLTIALGAIAAQSLLGKAVTLSRIRGQPIALPDGSPGWVTIHPSFLLRIPEADRKAAEYRRFVDDLRAARDSAG